MVNEKVLIYEPEDAQRYARVNEGIELFLKQVTDKRQIDFQGQFRWLAYLRPGSNSSVIYAGLVYLRDINDKSDPLAQIDGLSMIKGFRELATENIGAKVLSAGYGQGRLEIEAHLEKDFKRVLGWALVPSHEDYGLTPPYEVNRFILSLVPEARDRIIAPFLESKGYKGKFKFVTLLEDIQLPLADSGN